MQHAKWVLIAQHKGNAAVRAKHQARGNCPPREALTHSKARRAHLNSSARSFPCPPPSRSPATCILWVPIHTQGKSEDAEEKLRIWGGIWGCTKNERVQKNIAITSHWGCPLEGTHPARNHLQAAVQPTWLSL